MDIIAYGFFQGTLHFLNNGALSDEPPQVKAGIPMGVQITVENIDPNDIPFQIKLYGLPIVDLSVIGGAKEVVGNCYPGKPVTLKLTWMAKESKNYAVDITIYKQFGSEWAPLWDSWGLTMGIPWAGGPPPPPPPPPGGSNKLLVFGIPAAFLTALVLFKDKLKR